MGEKTSKNVGFYMFLHVFTRTISDIVGGFLLLWFVNCPGLVDEGCMYPMFSTRSQ